MRARDLAAPFPTVTVDTSVLAAMKLLADHHLPGLIVVDDRDRPTTILGGSQVLRLAVPRYCQDDPTLCRVLDDPEAEGLLSDLADRTVADCLPDQPKQLPVVDADATSLQVSALMARMSSPIAAVVGLDGRMIGAITLDAVVGLILRIPHPA